jgi:histidinol dehydrogenase
MIVGPGNIYVTAAKAYLAGIGQVGIDCPAGPSEVLIIADESASARHIAWDMIAQAEHDEVAWSILVTTSTRLAAEVDRTIRAEIASAARKDIAAASLAEHGFVLIADTLEQALDFANEFAPEHLEVITKRPEEVFEGVANAGSVFLGPFSPVAVGDYLSGTNHILPTGGSARFASGVGVSTFLKSITFQRLTQASLRALEKPLIELATCEGLPAHGKSVVVRGGEPPL